MPTQSPTLETQNVRSPLPSEMNLIRRLLEQIELLNQRLGRLEERFQLERLPALGSRTPTQPGPSTPESKVDAVEDQVATPGDEASETESLSTITEGKYRCFISGCGKEYSRPDRFIKHVRDAQKDGHEILLGFIDEKACRYCKFKARSSHGLADHEYVKHRELYPLSVQRSGGAYMHFLQKRAHEGGSEDQSKAKRVRLDASGIPMSRIMSASLDAEPHIRDAVQGSNHTPFHSANDSLGEPRPGALQNDFQASIQDLHSLEGWQSISNGQDFEVTSYGVPLCTRDSASSSLWWQNM